jgi:hypothetical protein
MPFLPTIKQYAPKQYAGQAGFQSGSDREGHELYSCRNAHLNKGGFSR